MKKFLLSALTVALFATAAIADDRAYQAVTLGTSRIDGSTATNVAYVIDCKDQQNVAVQIIQGCTPVAQTGAIQVAYSLSVDGITYSHPVYQIFGVASSPYTTNYITTNINCQGYGYLKIQWITNANAANLFVTNTVKYAAKIGAP